MLNLPGAFASIAAKVTGAFGGPFHDGYVVSQATPGGPDDNGVFQPGAPATRRPCQCQIDADSVTMAASDGFADGSVVFIILAATLEGTLGTDATVVIPAGDRAGTWLVSSINRDPMSIGWSGKGRLK